MIKAVLFDLDGTIANSLKDLANATNIALEKYGFPTRQTEEFKYFVGDGIPKMLERALPEGEKTSESVERLLAVFKPFYAVHYADNTYPYEGVTELIASLKADGIKTAVVTNKVQEMADIVVNKLYGNVFDIVFGKREGIPAKPDPTAALMTMKSLGVKPEECIFMGDSGMDVAAAVNSGALPVGVLWGFRDREELMQNGARYIIEKPAELLEIIKENNK